MKNQITWSPTCLVNSTSDFSLLFFSLIKVSLHWSLCFVTQFRPVDTCGKLETEQWRSNEGKMLVCSDTENIISAICQTLSCALHWDEHR